MYEWLCRSRVWVQDERDRRRAHVCRNNISTHREDFSVVCVTSSAILSDVTLTVRVFAEVVVEVFGEGSCVASDFAAFQTVPYGYAFVLGVRGGL